MIPEVEAVWRKRMEEIPAEPGAMRDDAGRLRYAARQTGIPGNDGGVFSTAVSAGTLTRETSR